MWLMWDVKSVVSKHRLTELVVLWVIKKLLYDQWSLLICFSHIFECHCQTHRQYCWRKKSQHFQGFEGLNQNQRRLVQGLKLWGLVGGLCKVSIILTIIILIRRVNTKTSRNDIFWRLITKAPHSIVSLWLGHMKHVNVSTGVLIAKLVCNSCSGSDPTRKLD